MEHEFQRDKHEEKLIMLSVPEKAVFGHDAMLHPISQMPLETGHGALDPSAQVIGHYGVLLYRLAELTQRRKDRDGPALAAEHEALAIRVATVRAKLDEEGIIAKYGMAPASSSLGAIRDKGWSIPSAPPIAAPAPAATPAPSVFNSLGEDA